MLPEGFRGDAKVLAPNNITGAASKLAVEPAVIDAVLKVETNGSGFLPDGRPRILFERHIFARLTSNRFNDRKEISSTTPGGYLGGDKEYTRLEAAYAIAPNAALQAASWGLFQLMGFNYGACNHRDVDHFVSAMCASEGLQLDAFVEFVLKNNLVQPLRDKDWVEFARRYNGPAYAKNKYDEKLAEAYAEAAVAYAPKDDAVVEANDGAPPPPVTVPKAAKKAASKKA